MSEYDMIRDFYEGKVAGRSGLPYMNHINEGLFLLAQRNVFLIAKKAWCLHPLIQGHSEFEINHPTFFEWGMRGGEHAAAAMIALEYRNVANQYTSLDELKHYKDVYLSPVMSVNAMLSADKVQNYKDAIDHVIPREPSSSERLHNYFQSWLDALGISQRSFDLQCEALRNNFPLNHDADNYKEAKAYYHARFAVLWEYRLTDLKEVEGGLEVYIESASMPVRYYVSYYVFKSERGKGLYRKWAETLKGGDVVLTLEDCNLVDALKHMDIPYRVVG